jgi:transcriptional regulator with XRE-family HTH domain
MGEMMDEADVNRRQFGARVRCYRELRQWKPEELAGRLGLSLSSMSRIEAGKQDVAVGRLRTIARTLGVSAGALVDEEDTQLPLDGASILNRQMLARCERRLDRLVKDFKKINVA